MKLLNFEISGLKIFDNNHPILVDFINEKRVNENEVEEGIVTKLADKLYQLNSLAFVGINASGKTTMLQIIKDVLDIYVMNKSLSRDMGIAVTGNGTVEMSAVVMNENILYRIESTVRVEPTRIFFTDEKLYQKIIPSASTREEMMTFDETVLVEERSKTDNAYLKDVDSIFSAILNKNQVSNDTIQSLLSLTNDNRIEHMPAGTPMSFVKFLDPSIEQLSVIASDSSVRSMYELQFVNEPLARVVSEAELNGLLSSGTIKGINILIAIQKVFEVGGYLLVDEIENHFNKTIVINLLGLFTSKANVNGATLVFSTHYSEILDSVSRTDSIYVLNKDTQIEIGKYSVLAGDKDRKDKKKSALLISGQLTSAPKYQELMKVKRQITPKVRVSHD
ncbi:MAG: ATP-binding protein [Lactobacillaceae bacterium]|jgi:hypothetical protein|nr:ATP-binding protein [Lactobacillaceae bacterium]